MKKFTLNYLLVLLNAAFFLGGCETMSKEPLKTVDFVEIPKFMGRWYVIANIPTFLEKGAHNATESYRLRDDEAIDVTFKFNKDSFDGPVKEFHPKGFIYDKKTNAEWRMRFIWPFLADYLIIDLAPDYSLTVIGVPSRKYVWMMARTPKIDEALYQQTLQKIAAMGFDIAKVEKVPQK